jgi:HSP20 family molecular chaperone IbpA
VTAAVSWSRTIPRRIPLPEGAIADSAKATFRDGVLEVRLQAPPAETRRGRKVEITEGK